MLFFIGYYCGKKSLVKTDKRAENDPELRFSKLNNKEPAFIRKYK